MSFTKLYKNYATFRDGFLKLPYTYEYGFNTVSGNELYNYGELQIPPSKTVEKNKWWGFIGTTFDYLARIIIAQYLNNDETAFFENFIPNQERKKWFSYKKETVIENFISQFSNNFNDCQYVYNLYLQNIELTKDFINNVGNTTLEDIINICGMFSIIESYDRGNFKDFSNVKNIAIKFESDVISELKSMVNLLKEKFINSGIIKKDSIVIFNPNFGWCTRQINGADADIFIDGTLYDFKTTKYAYFYEDTTHDLKQLYCYYLLWRVAEKRGEETSFGDNQITRLAFYKARFGEIEYIDTFKIDVKELEKSISSMEWGLISQFSPIALKKSFDECLKEIKKHYSVK